MAFTPQIPLTHVQTVFDTTTGLLVMTFEDAMPSDEPDPAGWTPTKTYTVSVRPESGLNEVTNP